MASLKTGILGFGLNNVKPNSFPNGVVDYGKLPKTLFQVNSQYQFRNGESVLKLIREETGLKAFLNMGETSLGIQVIPPFPNPMLDWQVTLSKTSSSKVILTPKDRLAGGGRKGKREGRKSDVIVAPEEWSTVLTHQSIRIKLTHIWDREKQDWSSSFLSALDAGSNLLFLEFLGPIDNNANIPELIIRLPVLPKSLGFHDKITIDKKIVDALIDRLKNQSQLQVLAFDTAVMDVEVAEYLIEELYKLGDNVNGTQIRSVNFPPSLLPTLCIKDTCNKKQQKIKNEKMEKLKKILSDNMIRIENNASFDPNHEEYWKKLFSNCPGQFDFSKEKNINFSLVFRTLASCLHSVTSLLLNNCPLTEIDLLLLFKLLQQDSVILYLDLTSAKLSSKVVRRLIKCLILNQTLSTIHLKNAIISDRDLCEFAQAMKQKEFGLGLGKLDLTGITNNLQTIEEIKRSHALYKRFELVAPIAGSSDRGETIRQIKKKDNSRCRTLSAKVHTFREKNEQITACLQFKLLQNENEFDLLCEQKSLNEEEQNDILKMTLALNKKLTIRDSYELDNVFSEENFIAQIQNEFQSSKELSSFAVGLFKSISDCREIVYVVSTILRALPSSKWKEKISVVASILKKKWPAASILLELITQIYNNITEASIELNNRFNLLFPIKEIGLQDVLVIVIAYTSEYPTIIKDQIENQGPIYISNYNSVTINHTPEKKQKLVLENIISKELTGILKFLFSADLNDSFQMNVMLEQYLFSAGVIAKTTESKIRSKITPSQSLSYSSINKRSNQPFGSDFELAIEALGTQEERELMTKVIFEIDSRQQSIEELRHQMQLLETEQTAKIQYIYIFCELCDQILFLKTILDFFTDDLSTEKRKKLNIAIQKWLSIYPIISYAMKKDFSGRTLPNIVNNLNQLAPETKTFNEVILKIAEKKFNEKKIQDLLNKIEHQNTPIYQNLRQLAIEQVQEIVDTIFRECWRSNQSVVEILSSRGDSIDRISDSEGEFLFSPSEEYHSSSPSSPQSDAKQKNPRHSSQLMTPEWQKLSIQVEELRSENAELKEKLDELQKESKSEKRELKTELEEIKKMLGQILQKAE